MSEFYSILKEWRKFLNNDLLNEIKIKDFKESGIIGNFIDELTFKKKVFNGKKWIKPFDNNIYAQILYNTIIAGEDFNIEKIIENFTVVKEKILDPYLSTGGPIKAEGGREKIVIDSLDTLTFSQCEEYIKVKLISSMRTSGYAACLEQEDKNKDFELVGKTNRFLIYYPKTITGSIAIARSYYDSEKNKIVYDSTFRDNEGDNSGIMEWCTSVSGEINYFSNYHINENIHLYYLINMYYDPDYSDRKYCVGIKKENGRVYLSNNKHTHVNGDNEPIDKDEIIGYVGNDAIEIIIKDAKKESREEFSREEYYRKKKLKDYISLRNNSGSNIEDVINDLNGMLRYSSEKKEIANYIAENESNRKVIRSAYESGLVESKFHPRILEACKENKTICEKIITKTDNIELIISLAGTDDYNTKRLLSINKNTPSEFLLDFLNDNEVLVDIIAQNTNIDDAVFKKINDIVEINYSGQEKENIFSSLIVNPAVDLSWKLEEIKKLSYDAVYDLVFYSKYKVALEEKLLIYVIEKFKSNKEIVSVCLANKGLSAKNFLKYAKDLKSVDIIRNRDDISTELAKAQDYIIVSDVAFTTSKREAIDIILENETHPFVLLRLADNPRIEEPDIAKIIDKSTKKKLNYTVPISNQYVKTLFHAAVATKSSENIDRIARITGIDIYTYNAIINSRYVTLETLEYVKKVCPKKLRVAVNDKIRSLQEISIKNIIRNIINS